MKDAAAAEFIRPVYGSNEFINGPDVACGLTMPSPSVRGGTPIFAKQAREVSRQRSAAERGKRRELANVLIDFVNSTQRKAQP